MTHDSPTVISWQHSEYSTQRHSHAPEIKIPADRFGYDQDGDSLILVSQQIWTPLTTRRFEPSGGGGGGSNQLADMTHSYRFGLLMEAKVRGFQRQTVHV